MTQTQSTDYTMGLTSAASLDPSEVPFFDTPLPAKPVPLSSIQASASRLTSAKMTKGGRTYRKPDQDWQEDAWEMFDLVGEQRFLTTTLAGRMGQARFYVGEIDPNAPTDSPAETKDETAQEVLESIGGGKVGLAQMITRLSVNLQVSGDGWLVGIPKPLMDRFRGDKTAETRSVDRLAPLDQGDKTLRLKDMEWRMLSISEVTFKMEDELELHIGDTSDEKLPVKADEIYLIRVWKSHPRKAWEADSPTRSCLPVLRELVGLTMHISAQVDSRLAGAGLLIVPQSAQRAMKEAISNSTGQEVNDDVFTEALIQAMMTPINDRSSPSAVVPLVITVPDDTTGQFQHMSFATPLDAEAREMRNEAIRRLALGQDAPPELLLGVASMNHWGAWLVREDVITTHIEPTLALVCDALTTQYLRPVLAEQGYEEEDLEKLVVWYDVEHLISRPNRASDAQVLFDKGVINDKTLRESAGFGDQDAPAPSEYEDSALLRQKAIDMAMRLIGRMPSLAQSPGIARLVKDMEALLKGEDLDEAENQLISESIEDAEHEAEENDDPDEEDEENDSVDNALPDTDEADAPIFSQGHPYGR